MIRARARVCARARADHLLELVIFTASLARARACACAWRRHPVTSYRWWWVGARRSDLIKDPLPPRWIDCLPRDVPFTTAMCVTTNVTLVLLRFAQYWVVTSRGRDLLFLHDRNLLPAIQIVYNVPIVGFAFYCYCFTCNGIHVYFLKICLPDLDRAGLLIKQNIFFHRW